MKFIMSLLINTVVVANSQEKKQLPSQFKLLLAKKIY